jgi:hypothetical protein
MGTKYIPNRYQIDTIRKVRRGKEREEGRGGGRRKRERGGGGGERRGRKRERREKEKGGGRRERGEEEREEGGREGRWEERDTLRSPCSVPLLHHILPMVPAPLCAAAFSLPTSTHRSSNMRRQWRAEPLGVERVEEY